MPPPSWAFQVESFSPPPDEELVCSICRGVFNDPVRSPCNHVYCRICITKWLEANRNCPICRKRTYRSDIAEVVPLIRNMIMKLTMHCRNGEQGCQDKFTLEACEQHLKECIYEMIRCKNKPCKEMVLRRDLKEHEMNSCLHRYVRCKNCDLKMTPPGNQKHDCVKALQQCLKDKTEIIKKKSQKIKALKNEVKSLRERASSPSSFSSVASEVEASLADFEHGFADLESSLHALYSSASDDGSLEELIFPQYVRGATNNNAAPRARFDGNASVDELINPYLRAATNNNEAPRARFDGNASVEAPRAEPSFPQYLGNEATTNGRRPPKRRLPLLQEESSSDDEDDGPNTSNAFPSSPKRSWYDMHPFLLGPIPGHGPSSSTTIPMGSSPFGELPALCVRPTLEPDDPFFPREQDIMSTTMAEHGSPERSSGNSRMSTWDPESEQAAPVSPFDRTLALLSRYNLESDSSDWVPGDSSTSSSSSSSEAGDGDVRDEVAELQRICFGEESGDEPGREHRINLLDEGDGEAEEELEQSDFGEESGDEQSSSSDSSGSGPRLNLLDELASLDGSRTDMSDWGSD